MTQDAGHDRGTEHQTGVDSDIVRYYETQGEEASRLARDPLELLRVRELLLRFLPAPPCSVLDAGGGPGAYAFWLTRKGYRVYLLDPVPLHIEQATRTASTTPGGLADIALGDVRALPYDDSSMDAVVAIGPLYHLQERDDRLQAWREIRRVLRDNGRVIAVGIPRFATLMDGLHYDLMGDESFRKAVAETLATGRHNNPGNAPGGFTTAYFHRPEELREEAEEVGFVIDSLLGIEGPERLARHRGQAGIEQNDDDWWRDAHKRSVLLDAIRAVESEPGLLCMSSHMMLIATA